MKRSVGKLAAVLLLGASLSGCVIAPWDGGYYEDGGHHHHHHHDDGYRGGYGHRGGRY